MRWSYCSPLPLFYTKKALPLLSITNKKYEQIKNWKLNSFELIVVYSLICEIFQFHQVRENKLQRFMSSGVNCLRLLTYKGIWKSLQMKISELQNSLRFFYGRYRTDRYWQIDTHGTQPTGTLYCVACRKNWLPPKPFAAYAEKNEHRQRNFMPHFNRIEKRFSRYLQ